MLTYLSQVTSQVFQCRCLKRCRVSVGAGFLSARKSGMYTSNQQQPSVAGMARVMCAVMLLSLIEILII